MTTSAASDALDYGFAATGVLNDGVAEGPFVFVARSAIGVAQQDRISGFRTANEIAPQSLVHAIFVDEDAGQAVWFEDAAGSAHKKKYPIAEMEARLNSLLYAERPLLGGRLHCMVALQHGQWKVAEEPDAATLESGFEQFRTALLARCGCKGGPTPFATTVGRNYYLPHLHPLLVPSKDNLRESGQIITLRASAFDGQVLECRKENRKPVRAVVEDVFLHLGPERTVLLEWVLALETPAIDSKQTSLWHAILNSGASGPQHSIAAWLDFSASVRTCFKTYSATEMEKLDRAAKLQLFAKSGKGTAPFFVHTEAIDDGGPFRAPIVGLVEHYLRGFVPFEQAEDLNAILEFRFDERARVIQSVLVAGQDVADDDPNERQRAICEALLQGVDGWNSDFLYAESYSRDETNRHAYDRYKGKGSRYLISDHSFVYIGHGSFAASVVWPKHMRCSYPPMVRLLHMNGAILNGFSRELANFGLEWKLDPPDDPEKPYPLAKKFARLKGRYLRFLSLNWFEQVSSQIQGVELYEALSEQCGRSDRSLLASQHDQQISSQAVQSALSDQCGRVGPTLLAGGDDPQISSQASIPFSLLQLVAGGDPPRGDDVCQIPAEPAQRRRLAVRTRDRHLPRDRADVVEPVRPAVRQRHSPAAGEPHARLPALALAPRRGVREA